MSDSNPENDREIRSEALPPNRSYSPSLRVSEVRVGKYPNGELFMVGGLGDGYVKSADPARLAIALALGTVGPDTQEERASFL